MSEIYPEVAPDYDPEDSKRWHDELKDGGSIAKQARIETAHDLIIDIISKIALGLSAVICILGAHPNVDCRHRDRDYAHINHKNKQNNQTRARTTTFIPSC